MTLRSLLFVAASLAAVAPAAAAEGLWVAGTRAEARLVAAGVDGNGKLDAGIEIVMPAGWHTYWRNPGDAGIAPVIDFSTSQNIGRVDVSFPLPARLDDGINVSYVYDNRVLLPVSTVVEDRSAPIDLAVAIQIGVCAEICIPERIEMRLSIPPGENDAASAKALAAALAEVPGPAVPGVIGLDSIARDGGSDKRPVFSFTGTVPDAATAEVFVEGPPDWAPYRPEFRGEDGGKAAWSVKFSRLGATTPIEGAKFRVTIAAGGRAVEQTLAVN